MGRIGPWIALVVLLAVGWVTLRWLGFARLGRGGAPMPAPSAGPEEAPEDVPQSALDSPARAAAEQSTQTSPPDTEGGAEVVGVRVCVVDPADAPIAGARVQVTSPAGVPVQVTDAEGVCRVPLSPLEEGWSVSVEAEGFFPVQNYRFGNDTSCLRMHPLGRLAGRVLARDTRAPIAGASVGVNWRSNVEQTPGVTTDARGRFAGVEIPLGTSFHLAVRASGFLDTDRFADTLVVAPEERDPATEILLQPALVGEFQVLDSESGEPVAGAVVASGRGKYATDAAGRVRVDRSLRGTDATHSLTVDAEGYCLTAFEVRELGEAAAPIVLRLPLACSVVGVLRDARGEPLAGVMVIAKLTPEDGQELQQNGKLPTTPDSAAWPPNARWSRSSVRDYPGEDDQGRFELLRLPAGLAAVDLSVERNDRILATRSVGPLGPPGSSLHVDWQLAAFEGGGVRGRLLLNGEPHAGRVRWIQDGSESSAFAEDDGVFVIEDLVPGAIELHGSLFGATARWGGHCGMTATVQVVPGEVASIDLVCEVPTSSIRGTLSDATGAPLAGIEIALVQGSDRASFSGTSAADGTWSIRVADIPGTYRIECERPLREEGLEVRPGDQGIALHVLANGRLRFRAFDASTGERLQSVMLSRLLPAGESRIVGFPTRDAPDTTGWTEVDLPEGTHELGAWSMNATHRTDRRSVRIAPELASEVEFRLEPAATVTLRLDPEAGSLPADHVVLLLAEDEWPLVTAEPGEGRPEVSFAGLPNDPGRQRALVLRAGQTARVPRLAPGRHRFKVFPDDIAITPEWIDVPAEGVVEVHWATKP